MKRILFLFLFLTVTAQATIYYSDNGGNGAGSEADPWSLAQASECITCDSGDVVLMRGGRYTSGYSSSYLFDPQVPGVTYRSYPGEYAEWIGDKLISQRITVNASGVNNITLDSIRILYGSTRGIYVDDNGWGWTLKHCAIDSSGINDNETNNGGGITNGDRGERMRGWLIDSCTFTGILGRGAIHVYSMATTEIRYCLFDDNETSTADIYIKNPLDSSRGNNIHHNTVIKSPAGGQVGGSDGNGMGWSWSYNNRDNIWHHNLFIFSNGKSAFRIRENTINNYPDSQSMNLIFNNTFDLTGGSSTVKGVACVMGEAGTYAPHYGGTTTSKADSLYIFNNIFFRGASGWSIAQHNQSPSDVNGAAPFGRRWYSDYNAFVKRLSGDNVYLWMNSTSPTWWTLAQWQANGPSEGTDYVADPNSISFYDSANVFVNRGAQNYALDTAGANYGTMATGGGGPPFTDTLFFPLADGTIDTMTNDDWPTYMGAFDPGDVICPSVTLVTPVAGSTLTATSVNIIADFTVDPGGGNPLLIQVYGEFTDATPDSLIYTDTLTADSSGWDPFTWTGLLEDSTYYWRINLSDSNCVVQSPVRSFTVDSIPLANTCPTVTLDLPTSNDTLTVDSTTVQADFLDTDGDTLIVQLYGGVVATPVTLVLTDTIIADSANWVSLYWTSLAEDDMHYWRLIVTDTGSCADTSVIDSFFVNAVADGTPGTPNIIEGTTIEGVTIGQVKTFDLPRGEYERFKSSSYGIARYPDGWADVRYRTVLYR